MNKRGNASISILIVMMLLILLIVLPLISMIFENYYVSIVSREVVDASYSAMSSSFDSICLAQSTKDNLSYDLDIESRFKEFLKYNMVLDENMESQNDKFERLEIINFSNLYSSELDPISNIQLERQTIHILMNIEFEPMFLMSSVNEKKLLRFTLIMKFQLITNWVGENMIKKMIVGGVMIIVGFFLILFQLNAIDEIKAKDEMIRIYTLSQNANFGDELRKEDLDEIYIRKIDNKDEYLSELSSSVYYLLGDRKKNSILLKNDISMKKPLEEFLKDDENNIITLSFGIEEANAWDFKEYDEIDLYFVSNSPDKKNIIYENVLVYKIVNLDPFREDYSDKETPQYVSLLVPKENSYEILSNKRYGRFEIIIN